MEDNKIKGQKFVDYFINHGTIYFLDDKGKRHVLQPRDLMIIITEFDFNVTKLRKHNRIEPILKET